MSNAANRPVFMSLRTVLTDLLSVGAASFGVTRVLPLVGNVLVGGGMLAFTRPAFPIFRAYFSSLAATSLVRSSGLPLEANALVGEKTSAFIRME